MKCADPVCGESFERRQGRGRPALYCPRCRSVKMRKERSARKKASSGTLTAPSVSGSQ